MRIISAHIDGFGKFADRDFAFGEGINVIYGHNEAGKSTLHGYIEAMLLGPNRKNRGFARSIHESMEPWNLAVPYGGSLRVSSEGEVFRIERNLKKGQEALRVFNETRGVYAASAEETLDGILKGLTPNACRNTISIGQLSAKTGTALQKELRGYVENVGSTVNPDLSADAALEYLKNERESLRLFIREDAAKEYAAALSSIRKIESEIDVPENDNNILYYEEERGRARDSADAMESEVNEIEARIEKADKILLENSIYSSEDIDKLDARADALYSEYKEKEKKARNTLRTAGIVISSVLLAAGTAGAVYFYGRTGWIAMAAGAGIALVLLAVLIILGASARADFKDKENEVLMFMEGRNGDTSVNDETMAALKKCIHSYDGLLSERERDKSAIWVLRDRYSVLLKKLTEMTAKLEEQQKIRFRVEAALSEENALRNHAAELRDMIAENNRIKEKMDAIDIAIDTIGDLSNTIRDRLGTYLNFEASRTLEKLTCGRYRSMDIGTGNDISLNSKSGMISVNDISAGTMDQVYLAVRLAAARFMMGGRDELPLIFDDSFALYDDGRMQSAVSFISDDYKGQVLIFTCHTREAAALSGKEINVIEL